MLSIFLFTSSFGDCRGGFLLGCHVGMLPAILGVYFNEMGRRSPQSPP
jgi:hypothetical protein